jgi:cholesterol transport system auxiliary component
MTSTHAPRSALLCIAVLVSTLAGCGLLPKKQPLTLYAPTARVTADAAWPTVAWQLQVPRPHADELVDSPRIVVRPLPGELQVYTGAVWTQPAPDLVQDTLVRAFEDSGRIPGVARRGSGLAGDYELLLDLRRFESDYAGGAGPSAVIELGAKLVAQRSNAVVASRTFRSATPAASTDIAAVADALGQALGTVAGEVVGWTLVEGQRYDTLHPRNGK